MAAACRAKPSMPETESSANFGMRSSECEVRNAKFGMQSSDCGIRNLDLNEPAKGALYGRPSVAAPFSGTRKLNLQGPVA